MSYLLKTNRKEPRARNLIALVCIIFVLWFGGGIITNLFAPGIFFIFNPLLKVSSSIKDITANYFAFLKPKNDLVKENKELKDIVNNFQIRELDYNIAKNENVFMKGLIESSSSTMTIVTVLKTPDSSPYDTFIIDAGLNRAISEKDIVFGGGIVPIGIVDRVYQKTSVIRLFSSPGDSYDVFIGESKIVGKAIGRGGGNFEIILARGASVNVGDPIILPSISSRIFGVVEVIQETEGGTFLRILFKNPVSFERLRFVEVRPS